MINAIGPKTINVESKKKSFKEFVCWKQITFTENDDLHYQNVSCNKRKMFFRRSENWTLNI